VFRTIIIISSIFLVVSIFGGIFLWWPEVEIFLSSREKIEQLEATALRKEDYFLKLNALSEKMDNYSNDLVKINSALSIDPSIPALFDFVRKSVVENGLVIESLNLEDVFPSEKKVEVKEINFSLSISGTYPALKNFLSAVYKNSRMIEVDRIVFSSPQGEELFEIDLDLTSYSYLTEKENSQTIKGEKR